MITKCTPASLHGHSLFRPVQSCPAVPQSTTATMLQCWWLRDTNPIMSEGGDSSVRWVHPPLPRTRSHWLLQKETPTNPSHPHTYTYQDDEEIKLWNDLVSRWAADNCFQSNKCSFTSSMFKLEEKKGGKQCTDESFCFSKELMLWLRWNTNTHTHTNENYNAERTGKQT